MTSEDSLAGIVKTGPSDLEIHPSAGIRRLRWWAGSVVHELTVTGNTIAVDTGASPAAVAARNAAPPSVWGIAPLVGDVGRFAPETVQEG